MSYPEEMIRFLIEAHAHILWLERGTQKDNNFNRMRQDWFDARRVIGCKLADEIINECGNSNCYEIPYFYFPCLSSISLSEFKKMKAYFIWEKKYYIPVSESISLGCYLDSCNEVDSRKINCKQLKGTKITSNIYDYLNGENFSYEDAIRRKSYWNWLEEGNPDPIYNWEKASRFVYTFYQPLKSKTIRSGDVTIILSLIDEYPYLTNMFEYYVKCILMQHIGITKPSKKELVSETASTAKQAN